MPWSIRKPTDLINAETNRIPFRAKNFSLDLWKDTFRSWPSSTKGWKDWFLRIGNSNEVRWGERKFDQCIKLSIADMERNESLLIAASFFWSDTLNAFVFGHGPASPTLADVLMLTGLVISSADDNHLYESKPERKVETRNIGGWSGYIQKYRKIGSVGQREHAIFLNMWLDKFIFCGRSIGVDTVFGHVSLDAHLELMKHRSAGWVMVASLQKSCRWRNDADRGNNWMWITPRVMMCSSRWPVPMLPMTVTGGLPMILNKSMKVADWSMAMYRSVTRWVVLCFPWLLEFVLCTGSV